MRCGGISDYLDNSGWQALCVAYSISEFDSISNEQKSINLFGLASDIKDYVKSNSDSLIMAHQEWNILKIVRKICESDYCTEQVIGLVWDFQEYFRSLTPLDYFDQGRVEYVADRICVFVAKSHAVPKHILSTLLDSECHEARKEAQRNPLIENFVAFK